MQEDAKTYGGWRSGSRKRDWAWDDWTAKYVRKQNRKKRGGSSPANDRTLKAQAQAQVLAAFGIEEGDGSLTHGAPDPTD